MAPIYLPPWRVDLDIRPAIRLPLSGRAAARTAALALSAGAAPAPASLGLILTDDAEIGALNVEHMGHPGPTDVLSFPMLSPDAFPPHAGRQPSSAAVDDFVAPRGRCHLGDIVISVERAVEQADLGRGGQTGDVSWSAADELRLLIVHGVLHICGWDHADELERDAMRALERDLLGIQ